MTPGQFLVLALVISIILSRAMLWAVDWIIRKNIEGARK